MVILEILKYTIPSLILFLTVYYILHSYFYDQDKKRQYKGMLKNKELIIPVRLQAYERIILFLERISPDSLIMRISQPGMTSQQLQTDLLATIRAEFEHNLSQQLYVSTDAWNYVKNARANTIKLINIAAEKIPGNAPYVKLSASILDLSVQEEKTPSGVAIEFIKKEVQKLF
jgi:hypothetical protein